METEVDIFRILGESSCSSRILKSLTLKELGNLAQSSKRMSTFLIDNWFFNPLAFRQLFYSFFTLKKPALCTKVFKVGDEHVALDLFLWKENFQALGVMMKKASCLMPTNKRLDLTSRFLCQIHLNYMAKTSCSEFLWNPETQLISCCASFSFKYIAGWEPSECERAFRFSNQYIKTRVELLLAPGYNFGEDPALEIEIRNYLYFMYWAQIPLSDRLFWLELLLRHFCGSDLRRKSRLLFVLFGPIKTVRSPIVGSDTEFGTVSWVMWDDIDAPIDGNFEKTKRCFGALANAFTLLQISSGGHDDIYIQLMVHLFQIPHDLDDSWDDQNVAALLLLTSKAVQKGFFRFKILDGALNTADIFGQMFILASKFDMDLTPLSDLFLEVIQGDAKECTSQHTSMIDQLWTALSEHLQDACMIDSEHNGYSRLPILRAINRLMFNMMKITYRQAKEPMDQEREE